MKKRLIIATLSSLLFAGATHAAGALVTPYSSTTHEYMNVAIDATAPSTGYYYIGHYSGIALGSYVYITTPGKTFVCYFYTSSPDYPKFKQSMIDNVAVGRSLQFSKPVGSDVCNMVTAGAYSAMYIE